MIAILRSPTPGPGRLDLGLSELTVHVDGARRHVIRELLQVRTEEAKLIDAGAGKSYLVWSCSLADDTRSQHYAHHSHLPQAHHLHGHYPRDFREATKWSYVRPGECPACAHDECHRQLFRPTHEKDEKHPATPTSRSRPNLFQSEPIRVVQLGFQWQHSPHRSQSQPRLARGSQPFSPSSSSLSLSSSW